MHKTRLVLGISFVVALLFVTACNITTTTPDDKVDGLTLHIVAPSFKGETSWCSGDKILLVENGTHRYSAKCLAVDADGHATFNVELDEGIEAMNWSYDAIYPESALTSKEPLDIKQVRIRIPDTQYPSPECYDTEADIRVAYHNESPKRADSLDLTFTRIVAHGALILQNIDEECLINEVKLTMSGRTLAGECVVDLISGDVKYSSSSATRSITIKYDEPIRATEPIYFTCSPQELAGSDSYTVELKCGDTTISKRVFIDYDDRVSLAAGCFTELPVPLPDPEPEKPRYSFRRVTEITSGKAYLIAAAGRVAQPISSSYGYIYTTAGDTDNDGEIVTESCDNAYIFEATPLGYTILQAADSRYLYQTGNHNSFNLSSSIVDGATWSVEHKTNGEFRIENLAVNKFIQYHAKYDSFGSYSSTQSQGSLPMLYELDGELVIEKPEPPVKPSTNGYLEVPAERTDGAYPNALTIAVRVETEHNYTHFYDVDTYTSLWVAYTLESRHMGSYSRPNGWDWNPYISTSDQVNLCSRSYAGDYSRGHLIPNASRNGIREMQLQTFFVTNSVPQIQGGFNGGIWQKLEAALQDIAERETLYIVTGVAFNKRGENKTISYTKAKDDTKNVPVPNYFYKIALKVTTDSSGVITDASTIGFWFEHRTYSDTFDKYQVSVDSIEAWTGFDYFPELPDSIESIAEQNSSWATFKSF